MSKESIRDLKIGIIAGIIIIPFLILVLNFVNNSPVSGNRSNSSPSVQTTNDPAKELKEEVGLLKKDVEKLKNNPKLR